MNEADGYDPFAPEHVGAISFITQARLYDLLMAILGELNTDAAANLLEIHSAGALAGPSPSFNGNFITDEMNVEPEDEPDAEG
jgi:hypothetical protein